MGKKWKRFIIIFLCVIVFISAVYLYGILRRGPLVGVFHEYGLHFKESPRVVSRKLHLDLGVKEGTTESLDGRSYYDVVTEVFGIDSLVHLCFFENQLSEIDISIPLGDSTQVREKFDDCVTLIESLFGDEDGFSKDSIRYITEKEYETCLAIRDSNGATGASYKLSAKEKSLEIVADYWW